MLDHKYKVFYHLAQTPNTTKVAEELLLSQPAISKNPQIRNYAPNMIQKRK